MTLIPGVPLVPAAEPANYWHDTDRVLAICRHRDRLVASAMNADNWHTSREPFGTRPSATAP